MEPTATVPPKKHAWYTNRSFILFAAGLLLGIILSIVISTVYHNRGSQNRISCYQPTTQNTQAQYCVYYKNHQLVIGQNGSRGLTYTIPYAQNQVSVSWDKSSDALTITMPSSRLTIQASEYTSQR